LTPYDCYRTYLAVKNHFTKEKFDFFKSNGKARASTDAFNKRKDKYFFEKLAHYRNDVEVTKYFLAYFLEDKSWVGDMVHDKGEIYDNYMSKMYDLENTFREESSVLFESENLQKVFECKTGQHPPVLKKFLNGKISIETMVIYDKILMFCKDYDKTLLDPVWETVSLKIRKYKPFLNIDVFKYKTILREVINV
jgi:hypothetical protein